MKNCHSVRFSSMKTLVMAHCDSRGDEILVGDQSHIVVYEQGGASQVCKSED